MAVRKSEKQTVNTGAELIEALNQIAKEKGIDRELVFETIEASLVSACRKNFGTSQNIKVIMNRENGEVNVYAQKTIAETVTDSFLEMTLEQAREINPAYNLGDVVDFIVTPKNFGRIAAMAAKQVVVQKFKEAERNNLFNEFITKEREVVTGIIQRKDKKNYILTLGKADALLLPSEQVPGEEFVFGTRIKVYVTEVKQTTKGPQINVSRTHPELVKRLFEQEVPEVHDGTVEIKSISREAGSRTKISVLSKREGVDPVGACVGPGGQRVNIIVAELRGEKIDIIKYNPDAHEYIAAALAPSKVVTVITNENDMTAKVVVPDHQLSLAIGKEGQNVRLAARLTGWRIDIKNETSAKNSGFLNIYEDEDAEEEEYDNADYEEFYGDGENVEDGTGENAGYEEFYGDGENEEDGTGDNAGYEEFYGGGENEYDEIYGEETESE
ncbi:MAG: transcription termination factor NusA [Clostridiales bacterium]|jgi:N utilization substance protein A|nr:transcription termination factor NusA [Clostridiales bacterium]